MSMNSKPLSFMAGLALGVVLAVAGFLVRKSGPTQSAPAPAAVETASEPDSRDTTLEASRRKVASLEADNAKLASRVQELLKKQPASAPTSPNSAEEASPENPFGALAKAFGGGGDTNKMTEAMTGMMRTMIESQVSGKVSVLKRRLELTEEQERTLTSILMQQGEAGVEASRKMLGGKLSQEELSQLTENAKSPREEIHAILTPEQWEGFQTYEKEERHQQARAVANAELLQMQTQLGLDIDQEDRVKAVLSEQALAQFSAGEQFSAAGAGANAIEFMRQQNEKKQEALRGVLTPEQFDRYRKFQEQQMKMIETFMPKGPKGGPPSPVAPAPSAP
jgi:hypothetical protein